MGFQLPVHLDLIVIGAALRIADLENQPVIILIGRIFYDLYLATATRAKDARRPLVRLLQDAPLRPPRKPPRPEL